MNALLARQLRKHLPEGSDVAGTLGPLLAAVSAAYDELEGDRRLLEHTLEVTSEELNEANEHLRRESEHKLLTLSRYYLQTLECQQGMILRVVRTEAGFVHSLCRGRLALRLGWTPEKVEGRKAADFLDVSKAALLEAVYEVAWGGEEFDREYVPPEGGLTLLAHFQPLRVGGAVSEIIVSAVDITERKRGEVALMAAKEKAESADRAKSEFLAVMSHEIRTPLNAVLGFNSLLQDSPLNEDQRSWVETINQSGRSLLSLLNDILDFSKIEAGQLHFSMQPCDLLALLSSVISMYQPIAAGKGIRLELIAGPGLPEVVSTDPSRLRQVLVNLLSNAVKFTHTGAVTLTTTATPVDDAPGEVLLRFAVRDSGIGIDPRHHERLFKPFSQADASSTRQYGGTGLGLAISQRLARALGGDITFESKVGAGSVFVLQLRLKATTAYRMAGRPESVGGINAGVRVLVAEDHPHNRELLTRILTARGITPDLVETGTEAVRAALAASYDLILMDVRMPGMDGLEATRRIRAGHAGGPRPRIVAVTANAFEEEKRLCLDAGMDAVILKPFVVSELMQQVAVCAGRQGGA